MNNSQIKFRSRAVCVAKSPKTTRAEYVQRVPPTLEKYGVKPLVLVVGSAGYETIEGNWQSQGMIILEFEDREHFERWYHSPEYQEILPLRMQATSGQAILTLGR